MPVGRKGPGGKIIAALQEEIHHLEADLAEAIRANASQAVELAEAEAENARLRKVVQAAKDVDSFHDDPDALFALKTALWDMRDAER